MKHPNDVFYLVQIRYLGFRYHGWQCQPNVKTVQGMLERTLSYVLGHQNFKVLGASRTDAMVSAKGAYFELFLKEAIDGDQFLNEFNRNLPPDIEAIDIKEVDAEFNIIQHSKVKEYHYYFSFGEGKYPFSAPFISHFRGALDIQSMQKAAALFVGKHNFKCFCYKPSQQVQYVRDVFGSEIVENDILMANFFPKHSYVYKVKSEGFMRNQVRIMMGALVAIGMGGLTIDDIKRALQEGGDEMLAPIVPASGLMLYDVKFNGM